VLVVDRKADDVGWQQVGSELNPLEVAIESPSERVGQGGFTHAGHVFDQQVTTGNQRDDGQPNGFRLALDHGFDSSLQPFDLFDGIRAGYLSAADGFEVPHE
jgi:hypothetical protein